MTIWRFRKKLSELWTLMAPILTKEAKYDIYQKLELPVYETLCQLVK